MKKAGVIFLHIMFWVVIIALPQYIVINNENTPREVAYYALITMLFIPFTFYIFYLYIVPYTLESKIKRIHAILVYTVITIALITLKTGVLLLLDRFSNLNFRSHNLFGFKQQFVEGFNIAFFIIMAILLRISTYWIRDQRQKTELALREHQLELELLKTQLNPHFFFNTLNNIYSLVYKKSDNAPAAVMKLSEIMRYLIYESKTELVPLEKEVEQLENYIELEKLRIKDPDFIDYHIKGDISSHIIPPMLLITFAENVFKHGKRKVKSPGISIEINAENDRLTYSVKNYLLIEPGNSHFGEGLGMQNTRRRLELLYPDKHTLRIVYDNNSYEVNLELDCSEK
jgi:two-component system LytT family sensor kinase